MAKQLFRMTWDQDGAACVCVFSCVCICVFWVCVCVLSGEVISFRLLFTIIYRFFTNLAIRIITACVFLFIVLYFILFYLDAFIGLKK